MVVADAIASCVLDLLVRRLAVDPRSAGSPYADRIAGALLLAEQAIHHGPINKIKDVVAEYAASGLDLLVLMPEVRSLRRLELLSEQVLPEYRH